MTFDPLMWILATNARHKSRRHSCLQLKNSLGGFFSDELLARTGFVVVNELPAPPHEQLAALGLEELLSPSAIGLTLADTYYLKPSAAGQLRVHFHELVHVLQWQRLGAAGFVERYIREIRQHGYRQAPLEQMAYNLEEQFSAAPLSAFDVDATVRQRLNASSGYQAE